MPLRLKSGLRPTAGLIVRMVLVGSASWLMRLLITRQRYVEHRLTPCSGNVVLRESGRLPPLRRPTAFSPRLEDRGVTARIRIERKAPCRFVTSRLHRGLRPIARRLSLKSVFDLPRSHGLIGVPWWRPRSATLGTRPEPTFASDAHPSSRAISTLLFVRHFHTQTGGLSAARSR